MNYLSKVAFKQKTKKANEKIVEKKNSDVFVSLTKVKDQKQAK